MPSARPTATTTTHLPQPSSADVAVSVAIRRPKGPAGFLSRASRTFTSLREAELLTPQAQQCLLLMRSTEPPRRSCMSHRRRRLALQPARVRDTRPQSQPRRQWDLPGRFPDHPRGRIPPAHPTRIGRSIPHREPRTPQLPGKPASPEPAVSRWQGLAPEHLAPNATYRSQRRRGTSLTCSYLTTTEPGIPCCCISPWKYDTAPEWLVITRSPVRGLEGSLITAAYLLNSSSVLTAILLRMKSGIPDPGMNELRPGFSINLASRSSPVFRSKPSAQTLSPPPTARYSVAPVCAIW